MFRWKGVAPTGVTLLFYRLDTSLDKDLLTTTLLKKKLSIIILFLAGIALLNQVNAERVYKSDLLDTEAVQKEVYAKN